MVRWSVGFGLWSSRLLVVVVSALVVAVVVVVDVNGKRSCRNNLLVIVSSTLSLVVLSDLRSCLVGGGVGRGTFRGCPLNLCLPLPCSLPPRFHPYGASSRYGVYVSRSWNPVRRRLQVVFPSA